MPGNCSIVGCVGVVIAKGFCNKHYKRFWRTGDPLKADSREFHGMGGTPEYDIWKAMKARCGNPRHAHYHNYGGRGITVCEAWGKSFLTFYNDVGPRPTPKSTLDRIDNSLGYFPDNVKWVSRSDNNRNRRGVRLDIGKVREIRSCCNLSYTELADKFSVSESTIRAVITNKTWRGV